MSNVRSYPATQFPLRLGEFKNILESKEKLEIVGEAGRTTCCPIALVVKSQCGGFDICVGHNTTGFGGHIYENPEWVVEFIRQIDADKDTGTPITVEEALEVINSIKEYKMNTEYPLTLVGFKSWLESKEENEVVGSRRKRGCCPVANVLRDTQLKAKQLNPERLSSVVVEGKYTIIRGTEYTNPFWVETFVTEVDMSEKPSVSAKEALQIVNNLYICTVCNQYNPEGTNCGKKDNCPW